MGNSPVDFERVYGHISGLGARCAELIDVIEFIEVRLLFLFFAALRTLGFFTYLAWGDSVLGLRVGDIGR